MCFICKVAALGMRDRPAAQYHEIGSRGGDSPDTPPTQRYTTGAVAEGGPGEMRSYHVQSGVGMRRATRLNTAEPRMVPTPALFWVVSTVSSDVNSSGAELPAACAAQCKT